VQSSVAELKLARVTRSTDRHYMVLTCLERHAAASATAIAGELGLTPDEVMALLDDLAAEGFVTLPGMQN
jgi:predicted ArsR family transcriptional regulator